MTLSSDGSDGFYTRTATNDEAFSLSGYTAVASGTWPSWWLGTAAAPTIAPVLDNNYTSATYGKVIAISAGNRRLPGDLIWLKNDNLNTDGSYTATFRVSYGYGLDPTASSTLSKMWMNGIKVYDADAAFSADGLTLTNYDATNIIADPSEVADKGADTTTAYKQQLTSTITMNTQEFNGMLPGVSALWVDDAGGTLFRPWRGTFDSTRKGTTIALSGGDLTATSTGGQGSVLGTVGHSVGKYIFVITPGSANTRIGIGTNSTDVNDDIGSPDANSIGWDPGGGIQVAGVDAGLHFPTFTTGSTCAFLVDLTARRAWATVNGTTFRGADATNLTAADVAAGTGGLDISHSNLAGEVFVAFDMESGSQSGTGDFTTPFFFDPPGVAGDLDLIEVITLVALRCGYTADQLEFIGLDDIPVHGIVITENTDFKSFLQNAGRTYGFDYTESGDNIKMKKSVVGTVFTVDAAYTISDLVPLNREGAVIQTRAEEQSLPTVIEFSYQDSSIDFQSSKQRARRADVHSTMVQSFGVPFVMDADEAITAAAVALFREWQQRVSYKLKVSVAKIQQEPTDIITFPFGSSTITGKVMAATINSDLSQNITAVSLLTSETVDATLIGFSGDPNIDNLPLTPAVEPSTGSIIYTGFVPTVSAANAIAPTSGSIIVTGAVPTVTISDPFTTLDPADKHADVTLSNGNLTAERSGADAWKAVRSVDTFAGGKYHIEVTLDQFTNSSGLIAGLVRTSSGDYSFPGQDGSGLGFQTNNFFYSSSGLHDADNPGVIGVGDVLVLEIDDDNGILYVAINTGSYVQANYPAGITAGAGQNKKFEVGMFTTGNDCTVNFGTTAFVKTPSSGFVGLS